MTEGCLRALRCRAMTTSSGRQLRVAELLSIGSELTVGETRDTNAGDLARELTRFGVRINRITALPDQLETVRAAFEGALERSDLVISTGGLGPTPDDLTREAIAAALGETPEVDALLEQWLRSLWERRRMPFATINLKQAWLIPSATAIPNPNGTAPGWWVDARGGRVIVAMPGPPREMRPMWETSVLPRLQDRGIGAGMAVRTLRTTGIGESQLAELLGEPLLRATNPIVATYARADAVDIRISAQAGAIDNGPERTADQLADSVESLVLDLVDRYVWARGETTWAAALDDRLTSLGWTLAAIETGTRGSLSALLADMDRLALAESLHQLPVGAPRSAGIGYDPSRPVQPESEEVDDALVLHARELRERTAVDVVLAVRVTGQGEDSSVEVFVETPLGAHRDRRVAFLRGALGRHRAAVTAASVLLARLPSRAHKA